MHAQLVSEDIASGRE